MGTRVTVSTSAAHDCGDGTNAKTLLQYTAPTGVQAKLVGYGISFTGTSSATTRAQHRLRVGASGGTGTTIDSRIATLEGGGTSVGTAKDNFTAGNEPSGGKEVRNTLMCPNGPFQAACSIVMAGGASVSLEVIAGSMNARAWFEVELG